MKKILVVVGVLVILAVLTPFVILGQVPLLSPLFGAGQKDLGIKFTKEESVAAQTKGGVEIVKLPATTPLTEDYRLEGKRDADLTFTSQELTAHSNYRAWKNYPVKNLQIKINPDGSIQASAILVVSKVMPYATALGYSEQQIRDAMDKYHIPQIEVPVYVKGAGSVINDKAKVNAQTVKIGAIAIPTDIVNKANSEAESVINDIIAKNAQAFHAERVTFSDGIMHFKGQLPKKEYVISE